MAVSATIADLLDKLIAAVVARQRLPESTYRVQFHAGFTFRDAARIVPYLHELGTTDFYASPYLKARPRSMHGYDISDHRILNPEIGTEADYEAWVQSLQAHGMGQVLDIVPNHMGIADNENLWWNDVLENGPSSPYAGFFDIDWYPIKPQLHEKVLLPVLGGPYGEVLEAGQLVLGYVAGAFVLHYFEHRFPVEPGSFVKLLKHRIEELESLLGKEAPEFMEYVSILTAATHLPQRNETDPQKVAERQREKEVIKRRLATLTDSSECVRKFVEQNVACFNGRPGEPHSFDALDDLLDDQAYRLSFWRVAADEINYRRFFDINELAALSMEKEEVFAATHALILRLVYAGKVTGLRIDHPDGLYDPRQYLERLQEQFLLEQARQIAATEAGSAGAGDEREASLREAITEAQQLGAASPLWRPLYIVVEKILGRDEPLPEDWPVYGTTGYEFLNALNGLFVEPGNAKVFSRIYQRWADNKTSLGDLVYQKKFLILQVSLSSELHLLAHQLDRLSEKNRWSRDFTLNSLRHALREIIACFPVYRSYISKESIHPRDHLYVQTAVVRAKRHNPAISASIFDFIRDMILLRAHVPAGDSDGAEQMRFIGKFQQVTGPVMAKGMEDTVFYDYNRLISLNDVGGDPGEFGVSVPLFHRHNEERQKRYPWGLSASSTHDTKRSEDVRARINVLSEMPLEWQKHLSRWRLWHKRHRIQIEGVAVPDGNDEYLLYQTLVGAWPLPPAGDFGSFVARMQQYMQKAVHEAKVHSSWINPNPAYDEAVAHFVARILDASANPAFFQDMDAFQKRVSHYGLLNSLSQLLLKIASPGVPDIYQGMELWDFSLVDPDNRRPVDYEWRQQVLQELKARLATVGADLPALARELTQTKEDGRIKLYLTYRALHCRREHPGLFATGEYLRADVLGSQSDHVCAFVRRQGDVWAAVAAPRLIARLVPQTGDLPLGPEVWQGTRVQLPGVMPGQRCRNLFTDEVLTAGGQDGHATFGLDEVLAHFPVALLMEEQHAPRDR